MTTRLTKPAEVSVIPTVTSVVEERQIGQPVSSQYSTGSEACQNVGAPGGMNLFQPVVNGGINIYYNNGEQQQLQKIRKMNRSLQQENKFHRQAKDVAVQIAKGVLAENYERAERQHESTNQFDKMSTSSPQHNDVQLQRKLNCPGQQTSDQTSIDVVSRDEPLMEDDLVSPTTNKKKSSDSKKVSPDQTKPLNNIDFMSLLSNITRLLLCIVAAAKGIFLLCFFKDVRLLIYIYLAIITTCFDAVLVFLSFVYMCCKIRFVFRYPSCIFVDIGLPVSYFALCMYMYLSLFEQELDILEELAESIVLINVYVFWLSVIHVLTMACNWLKKLCPTKKTKCICTF